MEKKIYRMLETVVGPENISVDPAVLDGYTWQWMGEFEGEIANRFMPFRPEAVVLPGSTEEVQEVVRICNRYGLKFKAHSTGWGAWGAAGVKGVVLLDLRRMNRILEINEHDMYAVVEPYVSWAQLQAEAMKVGLNCMVIGAGSATSVLASCTSQEGVGYANVSMGYNSRNVLGVEWVLPDGEVLRLGSLAFDSWISGDGPGPSLRGVMRGTLGAMGGLGVFTKCAVRLYHWGGPPEVVTEGLPPVDERLVEPLENVRLYYLYFDTLESREEALRRLAESEIVYAAAILDRGLLAFGSGETNRQSVEIMESLIPALPPVTCAILLVANSKSELRYQEKVMEKILGETGGKNLDLITENPALRDTVLLLMIKGGSLPARAVFGTSGGFTPILCHNIQGRRTVVETLRIGLEIKKKHVKGGKLVDDMGEGNWGCPIIDHGHMSWVENETGYDPWDPQSVEAMIKLHEEVNEEVFEKRKIAFPKTSLKFLAARKGLSLHEVVAPHMNVDHRDWQRRIQRVLDPKGVTDPSTYIK